MGGSSPKAASGRGWDVEERELVLETPVFDVRRHRKRRPDAESRYDFYRIEAGDWVNVIPLTDDDEIVFIELYRHGTNEVSLEIPGGMIDPEDPSPAAAGARETREETGYAAEDMIPLGVVHPNPALQGNRCYTFLGRGARRVGPPRPDETEDIEVVRYPRAHVPRLLREGKIGHALVVAAFYWFFQREGKW